MKTIVIYGSGRSLLSLSEEQWKELSAFDSLGFNWFVLQEWIYPTYMLVGDIRHDKNYEVLGRTYEECYERYYDAAWYPRYCDTVFFMTRAQRKMFGDEWDRYAYKIREWEKDWAQGALVLAIKIAKDLGYNRIIFVGVDMYDYRHFFMPEGMTRSHGSPKNSQKYAKRKAHQPHPCADKQLDGIQMHLKDLTNIEMYSYNPKSLLLRIKEIRKWGC